MINIASIKQCRSYIPEVLSAFYLNSFSILRPLSNTDSKIIFVNIAVLFFIFVAFSVKPYDLKRVKVYVLLVFSILLFMSFDYLFRSNEYIFECLKSFVLFGMVPAFFFLKVYDVRFFLSLWSFFSVVAGLILAGDPFNGYLLCNGYMTFGMSILPAYAASVIQFFFFKRKIFICPLLFFLLEIVLFAHKGATFTALGLLLFFLFLFSKRNVLKLSIAGLGSFFFLIFYKQIIEQLITISGKLGVDSYSLVGFEKMFLLATSDEVTQARTLIWKKVLFELKEHFAIGMGIGGFELKYDCYPHNFFLEVLVTYGIPFGMFFFGIIFWALKKDIDNYKNKVVFVFLMTMFFMWFIPMMASFTYWSIIPFWIFLFVSFYFYDAKNDCKINYEG